MKRLMFVCLAVLTLLSTGLSACDTGTRSTLPVTSPSTITSTPAISSPAATTLPATPSAGSEQFILANQGNIRVDGRGYFYYQRVFAPLTGPTVFQNVTFTPYVPTVTITAPVTYQLTVTFADGASEQLQNVGLGNTSNIDINVTQHNNPSAGVMLVWQDVGGSLNPVIYLLVSE